MQSRMRILSDTPAGTPPGAQPPAKPNGVSGRKVLALVVLVLVVAGIAGYLVWSRIARMNQQMAALSRQTEEASQKLDIATQASNAALARASQAEQSALEAAQQRDQAESAKAQSDQAAEQARQQAQVAQQKAAIAQQNAAVAEQKAEEYQKARAEELAHLQQVLNQIADTRKTSTGLVMTLGSKSIRFDFDKFSLRSEDREVLARIAGILSTVKGYQIYVYGYTDQIGTADYNQKLSERRAKSVRDYLVQAGLDPGIISAKGFGEADPRVAAINPQANAINRRVEIGLVDSTIRAVESPKP